MSFKKYIPTQVKLYYYKLRVYFRYYFEKWPHERLELCKLKLQIKFSKKKSAIVVYDCMCSPPTYGDFLMVLMLGRYFLAKNISLKFFIITGKYREDWDVLNEVDKNNLLKDYIDLAHSILDIGRSAILVGDFNNFQMNESSDAIVPFSSKVKIRESIYYYCISLANSLCAKESKLFFEKFLLSKQKFCESLDMIVPDFPYITWHCRHSVKWDFSRNITEQKFLEIHTQLVGLYPSHKIMIVSDEIGCGHFKEICIKNNISCLFSKDFSRNFLGDLKIIVASDYHFMFTGGGISLISMYTSMPYEFIYKHYEAPWRFNRMTSWATNQQIFQPAYIYTHQTKLLSNHG
jgi:hypothetical protein